MIVPEGVTLTVEDDTEIHCRGVALLDNPFENPNRNGAGGLTIRPGGTLHHLGRAVYDASELQGGYWSGIRLSGTGDFKSVVIRDALTGLLIEGGAQIEEVSDCLFQNNVMGIQLLNGV